MKGNKSAVRLLYTAAIFIASAVILCAVFAPLLAPYDPSAVSPEEILEHSSAPIGLERTPWEETFFHGSFMAPGLPWPLHSAPHSVLWRSDCLWAWYRGISGD